MHLVLTLLIVLYFDLISANITIIVNLFKLNNFAVYWSNEWRDDKMVCKLVCRSIDPSAN